MRKSILSLAMVFILNSFALNSYGIEIFLKDGNIAIKDINFLKVITPTDLRLQSITNLIINDSFYNPSHGYITNITVTTEDSSDIIFQVNEEGVVSEGCQYSSCEQSTASSIAEPNYFAGASKYPSNRNEETSLLGAKDRYKRVKTIKASPFICSCCKEKKTSKNTYRADEEIICNACYGEKISKE